MANNRMYLFHAPTGVGIFLAKRMSYGWYTAEKEAKDLQERLQNFFQFLEKDCDHTAENQDDFAILMEDNSGSERLTPYKNLRWLYENSGLVKINQRVDDK